MKSLFPLRQSLLTVIICLTLWSQASHAGLLEFRPFEQTVNLGDQATVELVYSDVDSLAGAFDFLVNFDASVLSFAGIDFGTQLSGPIGSLQDAFLATPGQLNISEFSFLFDFTGLQNTMDDVFIAAITFDTLATGTSTLSMEANPFSFLAGPLTDDFGHAIALDPFGTGSIHVVKEISGEVPEAPVLSLLLIGGLGLQRHRKQELSQKA